MSISVGFSSDAKRINSTKQPSMASTYSCDFKRGCSLLKPTLLLNINTSSFPNYTAFKIGDRYYRITDIRTVRDNLFEIDGESDPLATFKTAIGTSSQYILRSSATFDGAVNDTLYPMKAQKSSSRVTHSTKFIFPEAGAFVFGIQGLSGIKTFGTTTYYIMDVYQAKTFMDAIFNIENSQYDATSVEDVSGIPEEIYKSIINPQQYIVSCVYLPFEAESVGGATFTSTIKLGWYEMAASARVFNTSFDTLPSVEDTFTLPKHPQNSRGVFINNSPYTDYVLSIMPFGDIALPSDLLIDQSQIHYKIIVDVITGQGTLKIYSGNSTGGRLLDSRSAQVGVPIAISGGVYDYSPHTILQKGIAGMLIQSAQQGRAGQPFFSYADGVMDAEKSPTINTSGSNGALDFLEYDVILYAYFTHLVDTDYPQHGRPLSAIRQISTIAGFIMCAKPELSIAATPQEKEEILRYMATGFFYE